MAYVTAEEAEAYVASKTAEAGPRPGPGYVMTWGPDQPGHWEKIRIGPKMRAIAEYVSAVPGQSISDVLCAVGISPRDRSSARAPIYRAQAAGLIVFDRVRMNLTRVFASEQDWQEFYAARNEATETPSEVRELADVVSAMPGCTKSQAIKAADVPVRVLTKAIDAGLILVDYERANLCLLFATERDKKIFYLRRELLEPGKSADRIAELQAEIDMLRAEAAQTWIEA